MIKAKKKFGQNFLKDESIKKKIIQAMPNDSNHIVEIGPGLGDLTRELLLSKKKVVAFEIDLELCDFLQNSFKDELQSGQLELVCGDVTNKWDKNLIPNKYHLIANLPYNVATNIVLRALADSSCESILVMIQKEVAQKFCARVGQKEFSSLSILANLIGESSLLFDVSSSCFDPPPKVTSSVIKIVKSQDYISTSLFKDKKEFEDFKVFLKVAFCAPRKTLVKNLQKSYSREIVIKEIEDLNLSTTIRPHQLSIDDYRLLFNRLK
jgi:16S rRNA (adenine1518-N6/adenine1519-N6)-dimethyltransferase